MTVHTYRPAFRVLVTKNVQRERQPAATGSGVWDITPYLGDGSTISVQKSLYHPCGSAVITLPDQPYAPEPGGGRPTDTLYGLLEPTDGVEIYLARSPEHYGWSASATGNCPVLMRGFIREIRRTERMGRNGIPQRYVVIQAQDYGAVFDMLRVWNLKTQVLGWPDVFDAFYKYGADYQPMPTADFMQIFVDLANQWLDATYNRGGWTWRIDPDFQVTQGAHVMQGINGQEGALWNLMLREMDSPWNELYIEDREDNPTLVYRPTPWRQYQPAGDRLTWRYLDQGGQTVSAEEVRVSAEDIVSLDPGRTDLDVQNLYWLDCPTAIQGLMIAQIMSAAQKGELEDSLFDRDHENNDPQVYGERLLIASFRQWPNETEQHPIGGDAQAWRRNNDTHFPEWWKQRIRWLQEANRDNGILESGRLTVKGDEALRIGKYLRIQRGQFEWEAYITGVTHTFAPFEEYTTHIEFTRGTGFWTRLLSSWPAYLREGRNGLYE